MKAAIDFESQLHTIPVRNEHVKLSPGSHDPELLIVEVELRYRGLMKVLVPLVQARKQKRYELAGLARELYEKLDGKRTVEALIDEMCAEEQLSFLEARALVAQYLRNLMQRGLIVIVPDSVVLKSSERMES